MISNGGEKEGETKFKRWEHSETLATQPKSEGCKAKSEGQRWNYLPVKKLWPLLRRITSKHHNDFNCLTCLHSFATEKPWIT